MNSKNSPYFVIAFMILALFISLAKGIDLSNKLEECKSKPTIIEKTTSQIKSIFE